MKQLFALSLLAFAALCPAALAQSAAGAAPTPIVLSVRVYVTDLVRSERFYREALGFNAPRAFGDRERVFDLPGPNATKVSLLQTGQPPSGSFAIAVADLDAAMRVAPLAGGAVVREARTMTGSTARVGVIADPDGIQIEVFQMPTAR